MTVSSSPGLQSLGNYFTIRPGSQTSLHMSNLNSRELVTTAPKFQLRTQRLALPSLRPATAGPHPGVLCAFGLPLVIFKVPSRTGTLHYISLYLTTPNLVHSRKLKLVFLGKINTRVDTTCSLNLFLVITSDS